jgi:hypothetical protein
MPSSSIHPTTDTVDATKMFERKQEIVLMQSAHWPLRSCVPNHEQVNRLWHPSTLACLTIDLRMPKTDRFKGGGSICRYGHKVLHVTRKIHQVIHANHARLIDPPVESLSQSPIGHSITRNSNTMFEMDGAAVRQDGTAVGLLPSFNSESGYVL